MRPSPMALRAWKIVGGGLVFGAGLGTVLWTFSASLVFYYTPSEIARGAYRGHKVRLGGLVARQSVRHDGMCCSFGVTDGSQKIKVRYCGILPRLFGEGQGVVAEGHFDATEHIFIAQALLIKHDEIYAPSRDEVCAPSCPPSR